MTISMIVAMNSLGVILCSIAVIGCVSSCQSMRKRINLIEEQLYYLSMDVGKVYGSEKLESKH
jgi:hypothetical protein